MDIALVIAAIGIVVATVLLWSPPGSAMRMRLRSADDHEVLPREIMLRRSFYDRGLAPAVRFLADAARTFTPVSQRSLLTHRLQMAGFHRRHAIEVVLAVKVLALFIGAVVVWLMVTTKPAIAFFAGSALAFLGVAGPGLWLNRRIAWRKGSIVRSLPQVVDLITACAEAGLSFDAAVQHVQPTLGTLDRPIAQELGLYLADVAMGQSRALALMEMAARCGVDEVRGFAAAIIQGEQLGQGIGTALRAQSLHLRTRRRQRAQEEAMKAPVKILVPLVFFIFPAMFVVILGPGVLRLVDALGNMGVSAH